MYCHALQEGAEVMRLWQQLLRICQDGAACRKVMRQQEQTGALDSHFVLRCLLSSSFDCQQLTTTNSSNAATAFAVSKQDSLWC
jgi:hypothetical protein